MASEVCKHSDIRKFDGLRSCLSCGEAVFESQATTSEEKDISGLYTYTNLNYRLGQEIRLCILLPGKTSDELKCELVTVNLEDNPVYDAVSYTWATADGDDSFSSTIHCICGGIIPITANCDAALRGLRDKGLRRSLWIDAICINQSNDSERNHQVGMMDLVYSRARCVRICLEIAFPEQVTQSFQELFEYLRADSLAGLDRLSLECLNSILSSRYFRRVWVIQEVALARAAFLHVNRHELLLTKSVMNRLESDLSFSRKLPAVLRWHSDHPFKSDFKTCLQAGFESECSDPRDKVFAMLSLANQELRSIIPVDYTLKTCEVYSNAVGGIMFDEMSLRLLEYASYHIPLLGFASYPGLFLNYAYPTVSQLTRYLDNETMTGFHPGYQPMLFLPHCKDVSHIWKEKVSIQHFDHMTRIARPENQEGSEVVLIRRDLPNHDIIPFPRIQVRAHLIDRITGIITRLGFDSTQTNGGDQFFGISSHIAPFFRKDPKIHATQGEQGNHAIVDVAGMRAFCRTVPTLPSSFKVRRPTIFFMTHNTIGYASVRCLPGDEIWAVDGIKVLLILQRREDETYRIVGRCHAWAALELDYWNPGTKKGRWREDSIGPVEQQTRIIEIY